MVTYIMDVTWKMCVTWYLKHCVFTIDRLQYKSVLVALTFIKSVNI